VKLHTNNEETTSLLCRKVIVFTFLALVENLYSTEPD